MIKGHKTLLHYFPQAVIILGQNNEVVYMNPPARSIFGVEEDEELTIKDLIDENNMRLFSFAAGKVRTKKEVFTFQIQEKDRFLKLSISPVVEKDDVTGLLILIEDITEEMKSAFTKSYLIRNILERIEFSLKNLKETMEKISRIKGIEESDKLFELLPAMKKIEQELSIAKDASVISPKKIEMEMGGVIKGIIKGLEEEFHAKGINLNYKTSSSIPRVFINREEFEGITISLLKEILSKINEKEDIWITVEERALNEIKYGICLITSSVEVPEVLLDEMKKYVEKEDGIFEFSKIEGIGSSVGIALPSI